MLGKKGFTLIELMLTVGIISLLAGVAFINLMKPLNTANLYSSVDTLMANVKGTQVNSLAGAHGGQAHGVHFAANSYTLFTGASYNPADTSNLITQLGSGITISIDSIPNASVVFAAETGEVVGFSGLYYQLTVNNTQSGESKVLRINRYGTLQRI